MGGIEVRKWRSDRGMNTVEYALLGLVGAAIAGGMLAVVKSDRFRALLEGVITRALS